MQELVLRPREARRLLAGHVWVYANEVDTQRSPMAQFEPGCEVLVKSDRGRTLGAALMNPHALICARLYSHDAVSFDSVLPERLEQALAWRERCFDAPYYRLVYGDSDGLPGLVIDRHGETCVVASASAAMDSRLSAIVSWCLDRVGARRVVIRNDGAGRALEQLPEHVEVAGDALAVGESIEVMEDALAFRIDPVGGQKTGWFYDQRENRRLFRRWLETVPVNTPVLDVFSYVGAWSLPALVRGHEVVQIDRSEPALALAAASAGQAGVGDRLQQLQGDASRVMGELAQAGTRFGAIVVDPPALVRGRKNMGRGMDAYRRLFRLAASLLAEDGLLVACSCSLPVEDADLLDALRRAGSNRARLVIVGQGSQAEDHPVLPAVRETRYLKCWFSRRQRFV